MIEQKKAERQKEKRPADGPLPTLDRGNGARVRGHTLVEMAIALIVTGVLLTMGVPRFQQSLEQSRADIAGANLRLIWSAQRLYWLENRTYAPDLNTLQSANLIDSSLAAVTTPYSYVITSANADAFTATATRSSSAYWSGAFTMASDGTFAGSVQQFGQGTSLVPGFQ